MTDLAILADEVELAMPSRELDARIHCAVNGYAFHRMTPDFSGYVHDFPAPHGVIRDTIGISWPRYTRSLDDALALVPLYPPGFFPNEPEVRRWRWYVTQPGYDDGVYLDGRAVARVYHPLSSGGPPRFDGQGVEPAIALCAAALRALKSDRARPVIQLRGASK